MVCRNMKSDRKYFVENLTCFVSRARNSGGVDTIRSFSVNKQLPPLVPTPPNTVRSGLVQVSLSQLTSMHTADSTSSLTSVGSVHSNRSHSSGSGSEFLTQDSDLFSGAPTTGESIDEPARYRSSIPLRSTNGSNVERNGARQAAETGPNLVNRKPALRKWLAEEDNLQPPGDAVPFAEVHNPSALGDRPYKILGPAPVVEQTVRRTPTTFLEKSVHPPPLPPGLGRLQIPPGTPGRAFVPVNLPEKTTITPSPPLSRMPSPPHSKLSQSLHKTVWVWTRSKEVMRSAVEVGWTTFIFTPDTKFMAPQWTSMLNPKPSKSRLILSLWMFSFRGSVR